MLKLLFKKKISLIFNIFSSLIFIFGRCNKYKDIKDLISASALQTSALITLWGLANYMNQSYNLDETIIFYEYKLLKLSIT